METMRAAIMREFGGPEVLSHIEEVPVPRPKPGEVLLRVKACGVCYLDFIVRSGVRPGIDLPLTLGHEIAGEVAEVGQGVDGLAPGDRVAATYRSVCGACEYCRDDRSALCVNVKAAGVDFNGGYAEYVALPVGGLAPIPDAVSDDDAAIAGCVLGATFRAVRRKARIQPGDMVLVTGAGGGAGMHAIQLAKIAGGSILARTTSPHKVEAIRAAGADVVLHGDDTEVAEGVKQLTDGRGVDVVLDCVGRATAELSLRCLARGGRLVFIGELGVERTPISVARMLYRETEIYGVASPNASELAILLRLIADGRVRPHIGDVLSLEDAADAHNRLATRSSIGRIVIHP